MSQVQTLAARSLFWSFQAINGFSAIALCIAPRRTHEATFRDPARVYQQLGFSPTAQEMLHNVLRGQGAAQLAISSYLAYLGPRNRSGYLLIALLCGYSGVAHIVNTRHHMNDANVRAAIGDDISSLYGIVLLNAVFGAGALWVFTSKSIEL